jgi:hypothetical protein
MSKERSISFPTVRDKIRRAILSEKPCHNKKLFDFYCKLAAVSHPSQLSACMTCMNFSVQYIFDGVGLYCDARKSPIKLMEPIVEGIDLCKPMDTVEEQILQNFTDPRKTIACPKYK